MFVNYKTLFKFATKNSYKSLWQKRNTLKKEKAARLPLLPFAELLHQFLRKFKVSTDKEQADTYPINKHSTTSWLTIII